MTRPNVHRHALHPQGWPLTREGLLEDGYDASDETEQVRKVTLMGQTVAKRYAEGGIFIHVHVNLSLDPPLR
jgi:hypothetical protein